MEIDDGIICTLEVNLDNIQKAAKIRMEAQQQTGRRGSVWYPQHVPAFGSSSPGMPFDAMAASFVNGGYPSETAGGRRGSTFNMPGGMPQIVNSGLVDAVPPSSQTSGSARRDSR